MFDVAMQLHTLVGFVFMSKKNLWNGWPTMNSSMLRNATLAVNAICGGGNTARDII